MTDYEDLIYDVKDRIGLITLNRPDKLNAWTAAMEKSLKHALAAAVTDDAVRVIVVTGAGRGFCAGADMGLLQQIKPGNWEDRELAKAAREEKFNFASGLGPDVAAHLGGRFGYLMQVKKPIIAAINGPAAGSASSLRFMPTCALQARTPNSPPHLQAAASLPNTVFRGCCRALSVRPMRWTSFCRRAR
jgi:enoyl-CoA hydratase/carnithine racemase